MVARIGGIALALLLGCGEASVCGVGSVEQAGTCMPVCVEACGEHEACVTADDRAQCECVAGYEGDPCVWGGAPEDPEFTSQEAWSDTTDGASVQPLAAGLKGQGIASFQSSVVCNAGAVSQVVEMPPYELADPFVIEVTYRSIDTPGVAVGYNRAFTRLPNTQGSWITRRVCMGEAGYGGPVKFQVAAAERLASCFTAPTGSIEVDRFEVLVAEPGECPQRGSVLNGAAEVGEGGWFFEPQALPSEGLAKGSLEPGVGNSGSGGARLYKEAGADDRAAMVAKFSVASTDTMPSPALRFWWRATAGHTFRIELGTFERVNQFVSVLDELISDGDEHSYTYCLPPWTHGNVVELGFAQIRTGDFVSEESELIVDDVEIIEDARCGSAEDVLDPSFDSAPNRWAHAFQGDAPDSVVRILDDAERARTGDGVLQLAYGSNQDLVAMGTRVWVPKSDGERGPLLVFHSKVPADPGAPVRWSLGLVGVLKAELLPGGDWRRNEVCLPPEWAERWFRATISVRPSLDPLEVFDPPKEVLLDDFEVTTDESCPAREE